MPVDFLPRELLHRDHVEKGTESVPLTTEVLSEATTKVPKFFRIISRKRCGCDPLESTEGRC